MANLSKSTIWVLVSIVAALAFIGVSTFLEGDVQTFAYIVIAFAFAGFAVVMSSREDQAHEKAE